MSLPIAIQTYFVAEAPQDAVAFAAAFAPDAIVHDEGVAHQGHAKIETWWKAAKAKYRYRAEPLDMVEAGNKVLVRARVSGDFPGSPAVLTFTFGLAGDQIKDLKIG